MKVEEYMPEKNRKQKDQEYEQKQKEKEEEMKAAGIEDDTNYDPGM